MQLLSCFTGTGGSEKGLLYDGYGSGGGYEAMNSEILTLLLLGMPAICLTIVFAVMTYTEHKEEMARIDRDKKWNGCIESYGCLFVHISIKELMWWLLQIWIQGMLLISHIFMNVIIAESLNKVRLIECSFAN